MILNKDNFTLKIAQTDAELAAAQRLRYRVFVEEMGARPPHCQAGDDREYDLFDPFFEHLILKDKNIPDDRQNVVGVYRLMRDTVATEGPGFYSAAEFDLSKITGSGRSSVELGRSCVDAGYRTGLALHLLWQGVADYVVRNDIELLFGVASFAGTDPAKIADGLAFLHHNHLAPAPLRVCAADGMGVSMHLKDKENTSRLDAVRQIPPLIKSYLRLGGYVGDGAFVDTSFNTIDVCLILDREQVPVGQLAQLQPGLAA